MRPETKKRLNNARKHNSVNKKNLPLSLSSMSARLAKDPLIFNLSETTAGVMSLYAGTSLRSFS